MAKSQGRLLSDSEQYHRGIAVLLLSAAGLSTKEQEKKVRFLPPKPSFGSFCLIVSKMADFLGAWDIGIKNLATPGFGSLFSVDIMFEPKSTDWKEPKRVPFSFLFPFHGLQVREGKCVGVVECNCC